MGKSVKRREQLRLQAHADKDALAGGRRAASLPARWDVLIHDKNHVNTKSGGVEAAVAGQRLSSPEEDGGRPAKQSGHMPGPVEAHGRGRVTRGQGDSPLWRAFWSCGLRGLRLAACAFMIQK
ncbi:hypothetical protein MesoLjLb_54710 [Mesorhizobium sp. L-8-3]|nr:hypothetical protein MesoLjLb_54710 [Mesorhizobium sp. L-8-3]